MELRFRPVITRRLLLFVCRNCMLSVATEPRESGVQETRHREGGVKR